MTTDCYARTYGYDLVGNRLKMTDTHGGGTDTVTYAYDNRDRLTTETHPAGDTISYVFDDAGNEVSKTTSGGTTATESYTYDDLNRMTNDSVVGGDSTDYHYDDQGNQVYISDSGQVLWDTNNLSGYAQEIQENNSRTFFTGLAVLAQWINSTGGANYLLADGHGSTRYVTDSSGGVQNEILYDSFGNTLTTQPGSIYATKVLFTGQWFRSASGMYDLRARMYDPNVGRFTTQDSLLFSPGDLGNSDLYVYCSGNPISWSDPSGDEYTLGGLLINMGIQGVIGGAISGGVNFAIYRDTKKAVYAFGVGFAISAALASGIYSAGWWLSARAAAAAAAAATGAAAPPAITAISIAGGVAPVAEDAMVTANVALRMSKIGYLFGRGGAAQALAKLGLSSGEALDVAATIARTAESAPEIAQAVKTGKEGVSVTINVAIANKAGGEGGRIVTHWVTARVTANGVTTIKAILKTGWWKA